MKLPGATLKISPTVRKEDRKGRKEAGGNNEAMRYEGYKRRNCDED